MRAAGPRHRQRRRVERGERRRRREQPPRLAVERRLAVLGDDAAEHGAGARDRDLLADDRPDRGLEAVDRAGRAQPGPLADQRRELRVGAERRVDGDRVGVEVEQPPHPRDDGDEVALVGAAARGTATAPVAGATSTPAPARRARAAPG